MSITSNDPVDGPVGLALWRRADRVLPGGGVYLSRSADMAGRGVLPGFVVAARGARIVDADGRSYIDFLCANGPNILGYGHPEIEAAAAEQARRMRSASLFPDTMVALLEALVARHAPMSWGVLGKHGSESVSLGLRVARQHSQRPLVAGFTRAYHGHDPEVAAAPPEGVMADLTRGMVRVGWNDAEGLANLVARRGGEIAAIVLNPLDQRPGVATAEANTDFLAAIEAARRDHGILLLLDDVRHGFRMHPRGSHHALGIEPDMIALGKALGAGHAVSALLAREELRAAARKIAYTSTYIFESPPMAAAMAFLEIYDRDQAFDRMVTAGTRLIEGMLAAARAAGQSVRFSGPPAIPTLLFDDDPNQRRQRRFAREAAGLGAIFHPTLNWFLSAAHSDADIDEAIAIAAEAFRRTPTAA